MGSDARRGKLTLFAAEGPRDPGALERVVLRVSDLDRALAALPGGLRGRPSRARLATFEAPEGLGMGLVEATGTDVEYDIDHVVLRVPDPARAGEGLAALGLVPEADDRLAVGDKYLQLVRRSAGRRPTARC